MAFALSNLVHMPVSRGVSPGANFSFTVSFTFFLTKDLLNTGRINFVDETQVDLHLMCYFRNEMHQKYFFFSGPPETIPENIIILLQMQMLITSSGSQLRIFNSVMQVRGHVASFLYSPEW